MLNFDKIKESEMSELKSIISKGVEKSELEKYYLFTQETIEKAKVFTLCYRFLLNVYNLIEDGELKKELGKEINLSKERYKDILIYLERRELMSFGKDIIDNKLFYIINSSAVNNLIDIFSVLTEKVNMIQISRFKGVILEGRSGREFKKIFSE